MKKDLTYAFIIRMHYPKGSESFEKRLALFRVLTLPRIQAQTRQIFDICVWCNEWHEERIKALDPNIKTFSVSKIEFDEKYDLAVSKGFHVDFTPWRNVVGLEKYDVQIGLDTDDIIMRDYVEKIEEVIINNKEQAMHVSFQPYIFELSQLRTYTCPVCYHSHHASAFFALYQPNKEDYMFAYEDSHLRLGEHIEKHQAGKSLTMPAGYCAFTVHGDNESTYLYDGAEPIML